MAACWKKYVWAQPGRTRTLTDVLAVRGSLSGTMMQRGLGVAKNRETEEEKKSPSLGHGNGLAWHKNVLGVQMQEEALNAK